VGFDSGTLWKFIFWVSAAGAGSSVQGREDVREGLEDAGAKGEETEFSFAADVDEAGGFEFLDVVGESGGGDGKGLEGLRATERTTGFGDAFEEFETAGIGEGFEDGGAAGAG